MYAPPEEAEPQNDTLSLRVSPVLGKVPEMREPAVAAMAPASQPAVVSAPAPAPAPVPVPSPVPAPVPAPAASPPSTVPTASAITTWGAAAFAVVAGAGWLYERRRRRLHEMEKDSVMWANVQPPGASIVTTAGGLDDILPDSPDPAEAARAIYVTAIGETNSRREATLIDLHQLAGKLNRRRDRGDTVAAVLLLQQHLVDFRFTSPWVFMELLELYRTLDRHKEWEIARDAFRSRFGQNAPAWAAPSTAELQLVDDAQLCGEFERKWPYRETRMFIVRWMLGEHEARHKSSGPPLLGLGIYRDMMFLDEVLDDIIINRPAPADSLL